MEIIIIETNSISNYLDAIRTSSIEATATHLGQAMSINDGLSEAIKILSDRCLNSNGRVYFVGNGGSAAIASHMAIDFWKNGGMPAMSFNDSSLLTCVSNDFSYDEVFQKPVEMFLKAEDVLVAISSSGKSNNILNAVKAAKEKQAITITLSGFSDQNPLKTMGDLNYYVDSMSYGVVENSHQILLHFIIDNIVAASTAPI